MTTISIFISWFLLFNAPDHVHQGDPIWYIWLDTPAMVNGEQARIVGNKPFKITCCVKSAKYNRLQKAAQKWVKENYDPNFSGSGILKNIEDESLALKVISDAKKNDSPDIQLIMVDYSDSCK